MKKWVEKEKEKKRKRKREIEDTSSEEYCKMLI